MMTLKQAVTQASLEIGTSQTVLNEIVASRDQDIVQMLALLSAVAAELLREEPYEETLGDGNWLMSEDGTLRNKPFADSDIILFDERLAIDGMKWRFLKAKGLEFGEEMRDFTGNLNKVASITNAEVIDLDESEGRVQ